MISWPPVGRPLPRGANSGRDDGIGLRVNEQVEKDGGESERPVVELSARFLDWFLHLRPSASSADNPVLVPLESCFGARTECLIDGPKHQRNANAMIRR